MPCKDRAALRYAGLMGHPFVVVRDSKDGPRTVMEANAEPSLSDRDLSAGDRVYGGGAGRWKYIRTL